MKRHIANVLFDPLIKVGRWVGIGLINVAPSLIFGAVVALPFLYWGLWIEAFKWLAGGHLLYSLWSWLPGNKRVDRAEGEKLVTVQGNPTPWRQLAAWKGGGQLSLRGDDDV